MTWVRIDDQFADHPKVVGLSASAFRLHVTAICYAARQETDGVIPRGAAFVLAAKRHAKELVEAGLWEVHPSGFRVHDYLEYNPSAQSLREKRAADSARKNGGIAADSSVGQTVPTRTRPVPSRKPEPDPLRAGAAVRTRANDPDFGAVCAAYETDIGLITATIANDIGTMLDEGVPSTAIAAAIRESARKNKRSWSYVNGIIRRVRAQGYAGIGEARPVAVDPAVAKHDAELADVRRRAGV